MAPHSSTFAWKIPWTEEPGRLQSMRSRRVRHNWATSLSLSRFTFLHWRRKWQPTPVFLPEESQGRGAWRAAVYGVAQSWTRLKRLSTSSSSCHIYEQCFISWLYDLHNNVNSYFLSNKILCTKKKKKASGVIEFKKERLRAFWIFSTAWKSLQSSHFSFLPPFSWPNLLQYLLSQEESGLTPLIPVGLEAALLQRWGQTLNTGQGTRSLLFAFPESSHWLPESILNYNVDL